jgi:ankyrin repeat protein
LFEFVKILLKKGADPMARDSLQQTALLLAASHGHLACMTHLLGRPSNPKMTTAEVDAADDKSLTSLHLAAFEGHERVCGALLESGASLAARDTTGITPMTLAQQEHPTKASLLALLSGAGPVHPPGTVCDHCGKTAEQAGIRCLKVCGFCQNARYCRLRGLRRG